jgi:mRNA interferase RelE/StbE
MYKVELSQEAQRFFDRCDKPIAKKLARCFQSLEKNPREGNNVKALKGRLAGSYRYRIGDLRVVYTISDQSVTVFVITIAKRSDVYE